MRIFLYALTALLLGCQTTTQQQTLAPGEPCEQASDCASNSCVAGLCCDRACTSECESCVGSMTGGVDGSCAPILAGTECGNVPPQCTDGIARQPSACDGAGTCVEVATNCSPYVCSSSSPLCLASCSQDQDCSSGFYCNASGECVTKLALGDVCDQDSHCSSNHCSEGLCCDQACTSVCESCASASTGGSDGACAPVLAGTECDAATCTDGFVTTQTCNGMDTTTCETGDPVSCGAYLCANATTCLTNCSSSGDCAPGHYCHPSQECVITLDDGETCTEDTQCTSGFCRDGVCCSTDCSGACETCSQRAGSSADGTCTPLTLGHPGSPVCAGGQCDGTSGACTAACASGAALPVPKPLDIIMVIDNSASMGAEIQGIEDNINQSFGQLLTNFGVDYRVIMVTDHGSSGGFGNEEICITPPLSGTTSCSGPPISVPGQFYHYDINVQSGDALCLVLDTLYGSNTGGEADEWGQYLDGWAPVLRPEAFKAFLMFTDDDSFCSWTDFSGTAHTFRDSSSNSSVGQQLAIDFDAVLQSHGGSLFFDLAGNRNYAFYSVVGLAVKNPILPEEPWLPADPITTERCTPGAVNSGIGYQWLSKNSEALRFPLCNPMGYNVVFRDIVDTLQQRLISCELELPSPPAGQTIDPSTVRLELMQDNTTEPLIQVADAASCVDRGYYIFNNTAVLCPVLCTEVQGSTTASLSADYLCQ